MKQESVSPNRFNSCVADSADDLLGGDMRKKAMGVLFELCFVNYPNQWLKKSAIWDVLGKYQHTDKRLTYFGNLNDKHRAGMRLGNALVAFAFDKRILGGIQLAVDTSKVKSTQWKYRFDKP